MGECDDGCVLCCDECAQPQLILLGIYISRYVCCITVIGYTQRKRYERLHVTFLCVCTEHQYQRGVNATGPLTLVLHVGWLAGKHLSTKKAVQFVPQPLAHSHATVESA